MTFASRLIKEFREKEGCVRDKNNPMMYKLPLEKCNHETVYKLSEGRWICEKCMTLWGKDPRKEKEIV